MAKTHGSVRIGPISLLTLVIVLCLAVMAGTYGCYCAGVA